MASPPPPQGTTPHIRLNNDTENILLRQNSQENRTDGRPGYSRANTERSLTSQRTGPSTAYGQNASHAESSDLLLPPRGKSKTRRYRDLESPATSRSATPSGFSSRRTSWSSDASRDSRYGGPFTSPFDDSRAPSRAGSSDEEGLNTQTVSEKYNILPSAGLLLYPEDVEKDDYLHNPGPNDKDRDCEVFSKRGLVNLGGLSLIIAGVLVVFVGYPI